MKRIMLIVAYDGTSYCGWQIQPGVPTIEGELNRALSELTGENITVIGASRTDAGVHSMGNVAVFDTNSTIPPDRYRRALAGKLPEDIVIVNSFQVKDDFHPRHCDHKKTYEYRYFTGDVRNPQLDRYSDWHYGEVDIQAMKQAAKYLEGEHDFTSFCAAATIVEDKVRTIYKIEVESQGNLILIRVTGNGFLYNMVRIIAGTLLFVGMKKINPEEIPDIIGAMDRQKAGPTAPAKGLTQINIEYEGDIHYENKEATL